ncbi:MAG TPA: hypothetical protein VJC16_06695 [Candidatus Nanoarchaeia archaeon]|nr:hypothetical protein [Candidatus Nanoarchaeia archaeon]
MVTAALAAQITGFFVVEEKEADSGIPQADPAAANATTTEPVSITGAAIAPQESTFLQPVVGFLRRIFLFWRD